MKAVLFLTRLALGVALAGLCLISFGAFFGFASPLLDAFNHVQPFVFFGTLILLILVLFFFRVQPMRAGMLALAATGFLASAVTVIPEQLSGWIVAPVPHTDQKTLKLMSHNLFGLNYDMARMAQIIRDENPDIIALQEYAREQQEGLHSRIVAEYPYFKLCAGRKRSYVAIYAKIPFDIIDGTQCARVPDQDNNPAARILARFADTRDTEFVFATTHLNWPVQINPLFNDRLNLGQKLHAMTVRKQTEWLKLSSALNDIELPVILTGDFNSTSWSYAIRQFVKNTNLIRHSRGLLTYPKLLYIGGWRETPAILSLDHVMASNNILVHDIRAGAQTGSDHLPLYAEFSIKPTQ